jgi:CheY-like chemotaxis protein
MAQDLINQNDYDLILTDLKMPGMDGRELYDYVVSMNRALADRMIFMTGYALSPDMQVFLENSGNRHIEKPFDINALRELIDISTS